MGEDVNRNEPLPQTWGNNETEGITDDHKPFLHGAKNESPTTDHHCESPSSQAIDDISNSQSLQSFPHTVRCLSS